MAGMTADNRLWKRIGLGAALAVPLVLLVLVVGVLPTLLMAAQREALEETPADHGIAYEDVSLTTADGVAINGWWMPDATPAGIDEFTGEPIETRGVIIFVHGANSNRADPYVNAFGLYKLLTRMQHHVLAIDMRNSGTSQAWGGGQLDWGRAEARDVLAAVDYAQIRGGGEPIIPFGVSMGGAAALTAAAQDSRIRGLILLDPMLDTYDTMARGTVAAAGFPLALAHVTTTAAGLLHGAPAFETTLKDQGMTYARPTLLIQDERDPVNRRIHAEEIVAANRNIDLWVAPHPADDHPLLAAAGGWGTHVAAFQLYPDEVAALLDAYLTMVHAICDAEDLEAAASVPLAGAR
ncbi:alpha/beta hydrolase [Pyruvatibacter mobilis]|uniref:alpha/beta hydrolase n=1 Tax=Pyruvatibacter mobilis TaxID=1712261 RepID=UPI003C7E6231